MEEEQRIHTFDMKDYYLRILRVQWTARKTDE
jgi:hypothetical protein